MGPAAGAQGGRRLEHRPIGLPFSTPGSVTVVCAAPGAPSCAVGGPRPTGSPRAAPMGRRGAKVSCAVASDCDGLAGAQPRTALPELSPPTRPLLPQPPPSADEEDYQVRRWRLECRWAGPGCLQRRRRRRLRLTHPLPARVRACRRRSRWPAGVAAAARRAPTRGRQPARQAATPQVGGTASARRS